MSVKWKIGCLAIVALWWVNSGNDCKAEDRMFFTKTRESDISSKFSLSLTKDLGIEFKPFKVVVDCTCLLPGFRISESGEWFVEFSVEWKDRLIVPVSFVFYKDKEVSSQTKAVYLVRNFTH